MDLLKTQLTSVLDELQDKNSRITSLHTELSDANDKHRKAIAEVGAIFEVEIIHDVDFTIHTNTLLLRGFQA